MHFSTLHLATKEYNGWWEVARPGPIFPNRLIGYLMGFAGPLPDQGEEDRESGRGIDLTDLFADTKESEEDNDYVGEEDDEETKDEQSQPTSEGSDRGEASPPRPEWRDTVPTWVTRSQLARISVREHGESNGGSGIPTDHTADPGPVADLEDLFRRAAAKIVPPLPIDEAIVTEYMPPRFVLQCMDLFEPYVRLRGAFDSASRRADRADCRISALEVELEESRAARRSEREALLQSEVERLQRENARLQADRDRAERERVDALVREGEACGALWAMREMATMSRSRSHTSVSRRVRTPDPEGSSSHRPL